MELSGAISQTLLGLAWASLFAVIWFFWRHHEPPSNGAASLGLQECMQDAISCAGALLRKVPSELSRTSVYLLIVGAFLYLMGGLLHLGSAVFEYWYFKPELDPRIYNRSGNYYFVLALGSPEFVTELRQAHFLWLLTRCGFVVSVLSLCVSFEEWLAGRAKRLKRRVGVALCSFFLVTSAVTYAGVIAMNLQLDKMILAGLMANGQADQARLYWPQVIKSDPDKETVANTAPRSSGETTETGEATP